MPRKTPAILRKPLTRAAVVRFLASSGRLAESIMRDPGTPSESTLQILDETATGSLELARRTCRAFGWKPIAPDDRCLAWVVPARYWVRRKRAELASNQADLVDGAETSGGPES